MKKWYVIPLLISALCLAIFLVYTFSKESWETYLEKKRDIQISTENLDKKTIAEITALKDLSKKTINDPNFLDGFLSAKENKLVYYYTTEDKLYSFSIIFEGYDNWLSVLNGSHTEEYIFPDTLTIKNHSLIGTSSQKKYEKVEIFLENLSDSKKELYTTLLEGCKKNLPKELENNLSFLDINGYEVSFIVKQEDNSFKEYEISLSKKTKKLFSATLTGEIEEISKKLLEEISKNFAISEKK